MKKITLWALILSSILKSAAYAQVESLPVSIKISAFSSDESIINAPIYLIPGDSVKKNNSLIQKSHLNLILKSLSEKGYKIITDSSGIKPLFFLEYNYFISAPELIKGKVPLPTFNPSTTVNINTNVNTQLKTQPTFTNPSDYIKPIVSEPLNFPQPVLPSGYVPVDFERIVYTRKLSFKCYMLKGKNIEEIWIADIESKGFKADLNEILPAMIFAAKSYLGRNLSIPKEVNVELNSKSFRRFTEK
jgi:hypothetical protein